MRHHGIALHKEKLVLVPFICSVNARPRNYKRVLRKREFTIYKNRTTYKWMDKPNDINETNGCLISSTVDISIYINN